ncbi:MAG TPA: CehA/McbA family metallohydrolase [Bryobacteraceae bacterium]|nr:CehA/McbA family metallohydrolase [Bryobacteraceae bacterium]
MKTLVSAFVLCIMAAARLGSQEHQHAAKPAQVPLQPMAQQARQLSEALSYFGQPLTPAEQKRINDAIGISDETAAVEALERVFDSHVLMNVEINAESRVKVEQGDAKPDLIEGGARLFLVKVVNSAHVTAQLNVVSPNSGDVFIRSNGQPDPAITLTPQESKDRWADISLVQQPPMRKRLSGLAVEYQILQIYSRDAGQRSAKISFNVGQGSQDIGFRNDVNIVFNVAPTKQITFRVKDENGVPAMASFIIRDRLNRLYPLPSKRLAPDFFFQPQVYRADGETVRLPAGYYTIQYNGGPESLPHTREVEVNAEGPTELAFQLDRWIDPSKFGWYSGDHHVHAAGCSHYMNPTEGVEPRDMLRQILGERLNIGSVLTWGPDYYYQKQFFSGHDDPLSQPNRLMHYDLEVSGFPSSHTGHIVLLKLKEQDYPGAKRIEEWPTWDLPIFRWAKAQGAITGFAHSGWGLEVKTKDLPAYEMPGFDGIGANEYIVDVTHPGMVDFISAVDTPYVWELNIWYHTLNVGFRTRIAGETDFPCIYDGRVGIGRTYAKLGGELSYAAWLDSLKAGRSYVSDGKTHLMDFRVNGVEVGASSDVRLTTPGTVKVTVKAAAYLSVIPNEEIRGLPYDQKPYWDVERARVGNTREVPVEIVVNGKVLAKKNIVADGKVNDLEFEVPVSESSWIAARVLPAAHTNPIFALVGGRPVRASKRSAQWCLDAVNQCWTQKAPRIATGDLGLAKAAYDHAREVYRELIGESAQY